MSWFPPHWAHEQTEHQLLRQAGWSEREIDRLAQWRQQYMPNDQDQTALAPDEARLRFLRWLVQEGKLTEDVP